MTVLAAELPTVEWRLVAGGLAIGIAVIVAVVHLRSPDTNAPRFDALVLAIGTVVGSGLVGRSQRILPRDTLEVDALVVLLAALVVVAISVVTRDDDTGVVPVMLPITFVGYWACLPDVERPLAALGAALALAGWSVVVPPSPARSYAAGALTGGVLVWVALVGGRGRPGSVVGALMCVGLLGVWPVARAWVVRRQPEVASRLPRLAALAVAAVLHAGFCAYLSRGPGLRKDTVDALVLAVPVVAIEVLVVLLLMRTGVLPVRRRER